MQYETEGIGAFFPNRRNHMYSPGLKLPAVQEYLSGNGSLAELSKKYEATISQGYKTHYLGG